MSRKTKKTEARTALVEVLAARSAQLAERDANAAIVREYLLRNEMHFCEREEEGKMFFSGTYFTDEGTVSIVPWAMSVSDDLVLMTCAIPLRVPEAKRDAVALYANRLNVDGHGIGTLLFDSENGGFRYQRDLLPSALKSNPDAVLSNHFLLAMGTMTACSTGMLEIIMDGKVKFFRRYFKSTLSADERRRLVSIPNLTPGDFRTVRERFYFLGRKRGTDNVSLLSALEGESAVKKENRTLIGFMQ